MEFTSSLNAVSIRLRNVSAMLPVGVPRYAIEV